MDKIEDEVIFTEARHLLGGRRKGVSVVQLAQEQLDIVEREKVREQMDPAYQALADRMELHAAVKAAADEARHQKRNFRVMLFLTAVVLAVGVVLALT